MKVIKRIIDTVGEGVELVEILYTAAGGSGARTPQEMMEYLIFGGFEQIDWELLVALLIENEIEDRSIGAIASRGRQASADLHLTVGAQTGFAL